MIEHVQVRFKLENGARLSSCCMDEKDNDGSISDRRKGSYIDIMKVFYALFLFSCAKLRLYLEL